MAKEKLKVSVSVPQSISQSAEGEVVLINNEVDTKTGTVLLRAMLPNTDEMLWPGQFVNVVMTLSIKPNAVVIPAEAVQTGQQGQYLFVVKPDQKVSFRPVVAGETVGGETVIEKGLTAGEVVVTDGQLQLLEGTQVKVQHANTSKTAQP